MVEYPMERGRADNAVESVNERQLRKIARDQAHPRTELCKMLARGSEHVLGTVQAHNTTVRQGFDQFRGQPSRPASRVKHDFIAAQLQPRKHLLAPTHLGTGKP